MNNRILTDMNNQLIANEETTNTLIALESHNYIKAKEHLTKAFSATISIEQRLALMMLDIVAEKQDTTYTEVILSTVFLSLN